MDFDLFLRYGPALLQGFAVTIFCWIVGSIGGMAVGFAIAVLYRWSGGVVRGSCRPISRSSAARRS